jgi:Fe-Mn family superoxide dismutase
MKTGNGDTRLAHGQVPFITIDPREHTYYLDYQNRLTYYYIAVHLGHLVNWDFATENLARV